MPTTMNMVYWKSEKFWVGKLLDHPEIMSQGETLEGTGSEPPRGISADGHGRRSRRPCHQVDRDMKRIDLIREIEQQRLRLSEGRREP